MAIDRAALAGLNLRQLKERALHIGAPDAKVATAIGDKVDAVIDGADDPKAAVVELIVAASLQREAKATSLRRELEVMTLGELKAKAVAVKVDAALVLTAVGDAAEPHGAAIGMIERKTRQDDWAGRAALVNLIIDQLKLDEATWTDKRAELKSLKLRELKERCADLGADMTRVEQVVDEADSPRVAVVEVVVVAEREHAAAEAALRAELGRLRIGEMKLRAAAVGGDALTALVALAIDDKDDPKAEIVKLIMGEASRVAASKAAAISAALDTALGVTAAHAAAEARQSEAAAARAQLKRVTAVIVTGLQNAGGQAFNAQCNGTYTPPPEVVQLREDMAKKSLDDLKKQAETCGADKSGLEDMFLPWEAVQDRETLMEMIEVRFYTKNGGFCTEQ